MNKGAIISPCGKYRYQLWRIWNDDKPLVMFVCLNPSTADANQDDPTLRRLIRFAYDLRYGGLYLGNLFAYRSKYPSDLRYRPYSVGPENDQHLMIMADICSQVVFAWGNDGALRDRYKEVVPMLPNALCFGKTAAGHPKHPLYIAKNTELIPFT